MRTSRRSRQREKESGAALRRGIGPHLPTVALDDLLDDGEPDAGAFEVCSGVQALEHAEQFTRMLRIEPHAVVAYEVDRLLGATLAADLDARRIGVARELERVAEQVREHLLQQSRVGLHGAQLVR